MSHVHVRFESPAIADDQVVLVTRLSGAERLSALFGFEVDLLCLDAAGVDGHALLTTMATLVFELHDHGEPAKELRRVHGIVSSVSDRWVKSGQNDDDPHARTAHQYQIQLVPRLWMAHLTDKNDIYMEMSVVDIIEAKLKECGLTAGDFDLTRLVGTYEKRDYTVQYRETDLAFLSRLAEDWGIAFHFRHEGGKDVVVFTDGNDGFDALATRSPCGSTPDRVAYVENAARGAYELESTRRLVTTRVIARDYNYRNPAMDILGEAMLNLPGGGKLDEFGAHVKSPDDAARLARIRAEEIATDHFEITGESTVCELCAGIKATLEDHPLAEVGELLLTEVRHHLVQPHLGGAGAGAYTNIFEAIVATTTFRPPRVTPRPVIAGAFTAIVQHAGGTDFGAIDEAGRYRVSFMFDSVTRDEAKASRAIRMAQPSAGADRGFHLPIKPGTEVLAICVNGDPDRPIIIGAVPNPQTASPVTAANAEKSILHTNRTMIAFDDKEARMKLTVGRDDPEEHVFQVGAPNAPELGIVAMTNASTTLNAQGVFTNICATDNSFNGDHTSLSSADVVDVAGVPHPLKYWKDFSGYAEMALGFVKTTADLSNKVVDWAIASKENELAALKQQIVAKQGKTHARDKQQVSENDGSLRDETEQEFVDRVVREAAASDASVAAEVQNARSALDERRKIWEDFDLTKGDFQTGTEIAEAIIKHGGASGMLFSTMSKALAVAITEKRHKLTMASYEAMAQVAKSDSKERLAAQVGEFARPGPPGFKAKAVAAVLSGVKDIAAIVSGKGRTVKSGDQTTPIPEGEHFNLQASTHSVAVYGDKNAFVFGQDHTTIGSLKQVAVVAGEAAHLKSKAEVEVAAGDTVWITGEKVVDVRTNGELLLASKGAFVQGIDSAMIGAGDGEGFGLFAQPGSVHLGLLSSVDKLKDSAAEMDASVLVEKSTATVKVGDSHVEVKDGEVRATGKKAELTLDSDAKVDGAKIMLG